MAYLTISGKMSQAPKWPLMVTSYSQTDGMKRTSAQILADNLNRLMQAHPQLDNNVAVARAAGTTHSHIRRIRRQESMATIEMLDRIARAFGLEPFQLLMDGEEMRRISDMLKSWGSAIPDEKMSRHPPPAPAKEAAHSQRKKGGSREAH